MNRTLSLLSVAALSTLAACGSGPPYAALPIDDRVEQTSNVVIGDEELLDAVRVGRAVVDRVPGSNQMKVLVPIQNVDDEPIQVLVQVSFLDGRQAPIGDETNRQVQLIASGSTITYSVISKSDKAQDWSMRIDWNR